MRARKARLPDAPRIYDLIAGHAAEQTLLPRSLPEICEHIRDFTVVEIWGKSVARPSEVVGCGALHLYGPDLAELRSIAVKRARQRQGAGQRLVEILLAEARAQGVGCVCLFTHIPEYFSRFGFVTVDHRSLPEKAWKDCFQCPRLHCCNETAMVLGSLPTRVQPSEFSFVSLRSLPG